MSKPKQLKKNTDFTCAKALQLHKAANFGLNKVLDSFPAHLGEKQTESLMYPALCITFFLTKVLNMKFVPGFNF